MKNSEDIAKAAIWISIAAPAVGVAAIIIACPRKEELGKGDQSCLPPTSS